MDIKTLNEQIKATCTFQHLLQEIGSFGSLDAEIAIILDNPSLSDTKSGRYFTGVTANKFFEELSVIIHGKKHYITSAVKHYEVLSAESHKLITKNKEFQFWKSLTLKELERLPNLKYIICLGSLASQLFQEDYSISKIRGSYTYYNDKIVFHMNNPNSVVKDSRMELINSMDLNKFRKIINGNINEPYNVVVKPDVSDVLNYLCTINDGLVSIDIETKANNVFCIGLCKSNMECLVIPLFNVIKERFYNKEEEQIIFNALNEVFDKAKCIFHNAMFDVSYMKNKLGLHIPKNIIDTMIMHYHIYPDLPHKLEFLTSTMTMINYYKDELENWKTVGDIERLWQYNAKDCVSTIVSYKFMENLIDKERISRIFISLRNDIEIYSKGMLVNRSVLNEYKRNTFNKFIESYNFCKICFRDKFNSEINPINKLTDKYWKEFLESKLNYKFPNKKGTFINKVKEMLAVKSIFDEHQQLINAIVYLIDKKSKIKELENELICDSVFYPEMNQIKKNMFPTYTELRNSINDKINPITTVDSLKARDGNVFIKLKFTFQTLVGYYDLIKNNPIVAGAINYTDLISKVCRELINRDDTVGIVRRCFTFGCLPFDEANFQGLSLNKSEMVFIYEKFNKLFPELADNYQKLSKMINDNGFIDKCGIRFFKTNRRESFDRFIRFNYLCKPYKTIMMIAHHFKEICTYYDNDCIILEVKESEIDDLVKAISNSDFKMIIDIYKGSSNAGSLAAIGDGKITNLLNERNRICKVAKF